MLPMEVGVATDLGSVCRHAFHRVAVGVGDPVRGALSARAIARIHVYTENAAEGPDP
jgi:hypothetical protein